MELICLINDDFVRKQVALFWIAGFDFYITSLLSFVKFEFKPFESQLGFFIGYVIFDRSYRSEGTAIIRKQDFHFSRHINAGSDHLHKIHGYLVYFFPAFHIHDNINRTGEPLPLTIVIGKTAHDSVC